MQRVFFIYSENTLRDIDALKGLKYWLPTTIDIREGKIKGSRFYSLDNETQKETPFAIRQKNHPIYITEKAWNQIHEAEKSVVSLDDIIKVADLLTHLEAQSHFASGRDKIKGLIEKLRSGRYPL